MKKHHIIWLILVCSSAAGQIRSAADSLATLTVATTPADADLYIDSLYVGKSPLRHMPLSPGRHALKAYYPSVFSWNPITLSDSVTVSQGSHVEKDIILGTHIRIQTDPPGGTVLVGATVAGTTPLTLQSPVVIREELRIARRGYDTLTIPAVGINSGTIRVRLSPAPGVPPGAVVNGLSSGAPPTDHWLTYASGATMITSGVLSAYLKDRANKEFDRYLHTRDAGSLSTTRRLDKSAAIALAVSQMSFVILSYILLSE